jgi:succinate dehydrogenase / fumarate reductase cytochrome b subunit
MASEQSMAQGARPLSPHLQIYRWYFTMALSIAHRASGVALAAGLVLLTWWLVALASGPDYFAFVQGLMHNILGGLILFGYTFVLLYHLANGIRHLAWDAGWGFEKEQARQSGIVVLAGAGGLTVLVWMLILALG